MKSWVKTIFAATVILLFVIVFFLRLFIPRSQIIVTPDFGRSDAWDFSFGMKYALWEALHEQTLPLWNKDIGSGFPLLSEGQTGALFIPNLVLFLYPDPATAYNFALVFAIMTLIAGMYWWSRLLGYASITSLFGAITLGFSGLPILHLTHITLLQGMSLFPIMAALTHLLVSRRSVQIAGILGLVGAQQIFAGFPQATFLTVLFCSVYAFVMSPKDRRIENLIRLALGWALMGGLGSIQLLPSWEFLTYTSHPQGFEPAVASYFSFPLKHLLTFISPFALGNPKTATYPPFFSFDGSIFWENTAYMGVLPLLLALAGILTAKKHTTRAFVLIGLLSLVLAWGKHSPLYFLYSFWPLSLFRVPSRFLWIFVFMLLFVSMSGLETVFKRIAGGIGKIVAALVLLLHAAFLIGTWWSYHLIVPADVWLAKPEITEALNGGRVFTIGGSQTYNTYFLDEGWADPSPYRFLRGGLTPNGNLAWGISQYAVTSGRILRRRSLLDKLLADSLAVRNDVATFSARTVKFLNLASVANVLSFLPLTQEGLVQTGSSTHENTTLTAYRIPRPLNRAHLVREATGAATVEEAGTILASPSFDPTTTVLLETHEIQRFAELHEFLAKTKTARSPNPPGSVRIVRDTHQETTLLVTDADTPSLLVLADTLYPGWIAFVDGTPKPVLAANIAQRAVVVPQGTHTVTFRYRPRSFYLGATVSAVTLLLTILLMVGRSLWRHVRIGKKVTVHAGGRPHSHDR